MGFPYTAVHKELPDVAWHDAATLLLLLLLLLLTICWWSPFQMGGELIFCVYLRGLDFSIARGGSS